MMTRRETLKTALAATALTGLGLRAQADTPLQWQYFQADEAGFNRTPVLVSGPTEAVLIDGGFTLSDGRALAEAIRATGKRLTTIYVTCNDPDYYFSLRPVVEAFPDAAVIAAPATVEAINANVQAKLDVWGPQLGENGPQVLGDVVIPTPSEASSLSVDGQALNIVDVPTMHDRRYIHVPSLNAVFGGVLVYSGLHVWTADEATTEARAAWIAALDDLLALDPAMLIPGHQSEGAAQGVEAVRFTRDYLTAFDAEVTKAQAAGQDSAAVIAAMTAAYPDLPGADSLELGAKVAMGEMEWG
ncbi:MAG: MBL fold metallo-hydrolase [Paracoccus sp. (in: a-proteobacteria)]|nr:MBL fold metallo-hydrolase [Paracoccus sp. (in: a-proteobacteria)]